MLSLLLLARLLGFGVSRARRSFVSGEITREDKTDISGEIRALNWLV